MGSVGFGARLRLFVCGKFPAIHPLSLHRPVQLRNRSNIIFEQRTPAVFGHAPARASST